MKNFDVFIAGWVNLVKLDKAVNELAVYDPHPKNCENIARIPDWLGMALDLQTHGQL